ncbi:hypothetical protein NM208_g15681 [Fusarium decemcellulare]|uniref:Uncharacterized protein n=1 Tax=Fusarium decemcellulare TaxID=57161 RepID=A0ACC1RGJ7_9HYPO|nr:hypothetical protein NM208_g15681 [Fusarium decemcellulare]
MRRPKGMMQYAPRYSSLSGPDAAQSYSLSQRTQELGLITIGYYDDLFTIVMLMTGILPSLVPHQNATASVLQKCSRSTTRGQAQADYREKLGHRLKPITANPTAGSFGPLLLRLFGSHPRALECGASPACVGPPGRTGPLLLAPFSGPTSHRRSPVAARSGNLGESIRPEKGE